MIRTTWHKSRRTRANGQFRTMKTAITLSRNRGEKLNQCQRDKRTPQLNPWSQNLHPYSCVSDACPEPKEGEKQRVSGGIHRSRAASRGFQKHMGREGCLCGSRTVKTLLNFDGQPVRSASWGPLLFLRTSRTLQVLSFMSDKKADVCLERKPSGLVQEGTPT